MSGCVRCRDLLSAELDGETVEGFESSIGSPADAHRHLRECPECTRWFARAAQVNRLLRTAPAEPGPGLTAAQLAHVLDQLPPSPSRRPASVRLAARVVLAVVGAAQVLVGVLPLVLPGLARIDPHAAMMGPGMGGMGVGGMGSAAMRMSVHMSHEYNAWNLAVGVSFLVGAWWTRHLAGALPVLVSFVAVLAAVSAIDLLDGRVDPARVVSHVLVLAGVGLIVLIVRTTRPEPTVRPGLTLPAHPEPSTVGERAAGAAGPRPDLDGGDPAEQGGPSPAAHRRVA
jgi:predicted anti-sigma-YlaC factor YlaD